MKTKFQLKNIWRHKRRLSQSSIGFYVQMEVFAGKLETLSKMARYTHLTFFIIGFSKNLVYFCATELFGTLDTVYTLQNVFLAVMRQLTLEALTMLRVWTNRDVALGE